MTQQDKIRNAIAAYDRGDHNIARMVLGQMLRDAKPKRRANPHYRSGLHDEICYCVTCAPIRFQEARETETRMVADGRLSPTWKTDKAIDPMAGPKLESTQAIADRLIYCACGHAGDRHESDKLGNLLRCKQYNPNDVGGFVQCPCDHFHYENEPIENEAA